MKFTCFKVAKNTRSVVGAAALWIAAAAILLPASASAQSAEELRLTVGKSVVIDYPEDIRQISTTDPTILDASPVTTREILLNAKGIGAATMVVWSSNNQRMFYNVTVELNTDGLKRILRDTFPKETIEVRTSGESISLSGTVSTKDVSDRAAALAGVTAKTVVNNLSLPTDRVSKQILLHVKFAQLDRLKAEQYGINFQSTGAFNFLGSLTTGAVNGANLAGLAGSAASNAFARLTNIDLGVAVKALQTRNVLQVLAEPTLVTSDGKEGEFLVGGEVPVPVLQGGNNSQGVTIQYREFGIKLRYTPQLTVNNTIKLALFQEVSALDYANATTLNNFVIPALSSRKTTTNVELAEGETFVVAGLLDNRETDILNQIPGISSIPIIGNLFKNTSKEKRSTELIMLVTPEITVPLSSSDPKPEIIFPNEFLKRLTMEDIQPKGPGTKNKK
ncbi:MAG: pilus assembly protein N-terminal domain-containing protein [Bryobacteraceae bacterium]